jgi:transposase-like protein
LYFLPLPQGHGSFLPGIAGKYTIAARSGEDSTMSLEQLRARWTEGLSHRGRCIRCGSGRVRHDGVRRRKASLQLDDGVAFVPDVPERRLRCGACPQRWFHPPEGITSRAHYQPCVVAHALGAMSAEPAASTAEIAAAHGCHRRTLGRWIERVAAIAEPALLASAVVHEADAPVLPVIPTEVVRPTAPPRTLARLLRALQVLALLEALASLRGLEPPALAHAAALVPRIPASAQCPRIRGDPPSQA